MKPNRNRTEPLKKTNLNRTVESVKPRFRSSVRFKSNRCRLLVSTPIKVVKRKFKDKTEDIINEFTNNEMEQYIHKFYMHDGIMPTALSIETPYYACMFIEDVSRNANLCVIAKR